MICPFCSSHATQVRDTRISRDGLVVRRKRICVDCNNRFSTEEKIISRAVKVIKRDGSVCPFEPAKILRSLKLATGKKRLSAAQLDEIVLAVTKQIKNIGTNTTTSQLIGELVMQELYNIDQVAYIRYASVYKSFKESEDFGKFIAELKHCEGWKNV